MGWPNKQLPAVVATLIKVPARAHPDQGTRCDNIFAQPEMPGTHDGPRLEK